MAVVTKWCFCGFLVLAGVIQAGVVTPSPQAGTKCVLITLSSTLQTTDRELIKDDRGKSADIISVVELKRTSSARCILDDTLVIAEPYVIAKKGCGGQFRVCYRVSDYPEPTVKPGCKLIRLLSRLNREAQETLEQRITSIRVVRQYQQGVTCKKNVNFGFRGSVAYAEDGCRAEFEVCLSGDSIGEQGDTSCQEVLLRSTLTQPEEHRIRSGDGSPVTIISVELINQLSRRVQCVAWQTYFYSDSSIIAKNGCEGRFRVCYVKSEPEIETPTGCVTVRLLSTQNNSARKKLSQSQNGIQSIKLVKQFPGTKCVRNQNFGIRGTDVYSSGGCRAEFLVCFRDQIPVTDRRKFNSTTIFTSITVI